MSIKIIALIIKSSNNAFYQADIHLFESMHSLEEANQFILYGQSVYTKLEKNAPSNHRRHSGFLLRRWLKIRH